MRGYHCKSRRPVNFDALLGGEDRVQMGVLESLGGAEDLHDEIDRGRECDVGGIGGAHAGGDHTTNAPEGISDYGARVATFGENAGIAVVVDDGPFFRHRTRSFEVETAVRTDIVPTAYSQPGFGAVLNHHQAWVVVGVDHG